MTAKEAFKNYWENEGELSTHLGNYEGDVAEVWGKCWNMAIDAAAEVAVSMWGENQDYATAEYKTATGEVADRIRELKQ